MTPKVIQPARVDYSQAQCISDLENKFQLNSLKNFKGGVERYNKLSLKLTLPDFPTPIQQKKDKLVPRVPWERAGCDVNNQYVSPARASKSNQGLPALWRVFSSHLEGNWSRYKGFENPALEMCFIRTKQNLIRAGWKVFFSAKLLSCKTDLQSERDDY